MLGYDCGDRVDVANIRFTMAQCPPFAWATVATSIR